MASVVIIHAAEDALPARALAEKLRGAGLSPVIETPPGEALRDAVRTAAISLALWSPRSIAQQALVDAAREAHSLGPLLHARMQNTPTPDAFAQDAAIDLTGWRGEDDFEPWRELLEVVTRQAGVPLPPAPSKAPASFFNPAKAPAPAPPERHPAPPPRPAPAPPAAQARATPAPSAGQAPEPAKSGFPLAPVLIGAVIAVAAIGGAIVWTSTQSAQTAATWEDVPRNDADALRDFLAGNPGPHLEEAQQALSDLEEQSFDAAQEEDSIAGYQDFLAAFPDSDHAMAARGRIAELRSIETTEAPPDEAAPFDTTTATDPDLLPPDAASALDPLAADPADAGAGPAQLAPPAPALDEPAGAVEPGEGPAELSPPPG